MNRPGGRRPGKYLQSKGESNACGQADIYPGSRLKMPADEGFCCQSHSFLMPHFVITRNASRAAIKYRMDTGFKRNGSKSY